VARITSEEGGRDVATYRILVSFQAEDMKHANLIDAWGANENHDFNVYNERLRIPINSTQAEYVKRLLRERIERASVVVCLIGATTSLSSWVNWELAHGKSKGKGLVGVLLAPHNRKPREINDAGGNVCAVQTGRDHEGHRVGGRRRQVVRRLRSQEGLTPRMMVRHRCLSTRPMTPTRDYGLDALC
jgi:MTH538 TIR-like domain (DUF1863)